jgi:hypothetical protein
MYDRQSRLWEEASRSGKSKMRSGHSYEFGRSPAPEGPRLAAPQVRWLLAAAVAVPVILVAILVVAAALSL